MTQNSLEKMRILNTRAQSQLQVFTDEIAKRGGISVEVPLLSIREIISKDESERKAEFLASDWIIFTSVNGAEYFFNWLNRMNVSKNVIHEKKVAAVGTKTSAYLNSKNVCVDLIPERFDADHLLDTLINKSREGSTFFYPKGNLASSKIYRTMEKAKRTVFEMVIYETVTNWNVESRLNACLKEGIDVITFMSPSAVRAFYELKDNSISLDSVCFAVIGTATEKELLSVGVKEMIVPDDFTIESLLSKVELKGAVRNEGFNV